MFRSFILPRTKTSLNNNIVGQAIPSWNYGHRFLPVRVGTKSIVSDAKGFWNNNNIRNNYNAFTPSMIASNRFCTNSSLSDSSISNSSSTITPNEFVEVDETLKNAVPLENYKNENNDNNDNNNTFDEPPHLRPEVVSKISETIKSNKEFMEAGQTLQRVLNKVALTDNNNNNTKPSPLVDDLLQFSHRHNLGESTSLSLIAVAISSIYAAEMSESGGASVSIYSYFTNLSWIFEELCDMPLPVRAKSFSQQLVDQWNSILSPLVPSQAELLLLQTPIDEIRQVATAVEKEYSEFIWKSVNTLEEWLYHEGKPFTKNTVTAVNNYFAGEIDLLNQLATANKKLTERKTKSENDQAENYKNIISDDDKKEHEDRVAKLERQIEKNNRTMDENKRSKLPENILDMAVVEQMKTLANWVDKRKEWFDPPKTKQSESLKRKTLNFVAAVFPSEILGLRKIWIECVKNLITNNTIRSLRPGATPFFSTRPDYGLRSRHSELKTLCDALRLFPKGTKESSPLIGITSLPRQGKTSLLDAIGHSPDLLQAFDTSFVEPFKPETSHLFVLYITFNAAWECKIETDDAAIGLNAAMHQLSLRLLAAACGVHHGYRFAKLRVPLQNLLTIINDPKSILDEVILPRIEELTAIPFDDVKLIILMDEFSNLEPKTDNNAVIEKCRTALYAQMSNIIGPYTALITSGFTPIPDVQTTSGRDVKQTELRPITTPERRQEMLPMTSEFFRLLASSSASTGANTDSSVFSEPIAVFELCKPSPGLVGALLEKKTEMKTSVKTAVGHILFLKTLGRDQSNYWDRMRKVLQWKSMQAAAKRLDNREFGELTNSPSIQQVTHLPRDAVLSPSCSDHLELIRIDPMFLARTVDNGSTSEFATFLRQLYNYGFHVTHGLKNSDACRKLLSDRFDDTEKGRRPSNNHAVAVFSHAPQSGNNNQLPKQGSKQTNNAKITLADWTGFFFEDAVATGILFQSELRRSFMNKYGQEKITFKLGDFLNGAEQIGSLRKETTKMNFESVLMSSVLGESRKTYEKVASGNNNNININKMPMNKNEKNAKSQQKSTFSDSWQLGELNVEVTGENLADYLVLSWLNNAAQSRITNDQNDSASPGPSTIAYFGAWGKDNNPRTYPRRGSLQILKPSLDTLHQPARPENNELVDIVYHIPCAPDGNRWVEVWIDTKHSNSAPFRKYSDEGVFPSEEILGESLANPLLQSPDSHVDHVVHIVITSFRAPAEITQTLPDVNPGRLSSYTLYYVHPDSTAFENLVSQPIKEAIPLLDQQDESNWTLEIPSEISKWKYYRAAKRNIVTHLKDKREFARWRNICFDEDCSIPLDNLKDELSKVLEDVPRQLGSVPLGCVIEALGIRPFSINTLQEQYDRYFRVKVSNNEIQFFDNENKFCVASGTEPVFQRILAQVTGGHIMHHNAVFWQRLFEHDKKLAETLWSTNVYDLPAAVDRLPEDLKPSFNEALDKLAACGILKLLPRQFGTKQH